MGGEVGEKGKGERAADTGARYPDQEKNPFKKALISSPVAFDRVSVVLIPFP